MELSYNDYLPHLACQHLLKDGMAEMDAANFRWGSRGPTGDEPRHDRKLAELDTEHLENILICQPHIGNRYRAAIMYLLRERWRKVPRPHWESVIDTVQAQHEKVSNDTALPILPLLVIQDYARIKTDIDVLAHEISEYRVALTNLLESFDEDGNKKV